MSDEYRKNLQVRQREKLHDMLSEMPEFAKKYFDDMILHQNSSNTVLSYCYDMKLFFDYLVLQSGFKAYADSIATLPLDSLDKLNRDDLMEYLSHLSYHKDKHGKTVINSESTMRRKVASLRSFYFFYFKNGYIKTNPASLITTPKKHEKEIIRLDRGEVRNILDVVNTGDGLSEKQLVTYKKTQYRDVLILYTFLGTGMRVSEMVGLNVSDVDFKNACFHVIRKGGNEAKIYFGPDIEKALHDYLHFERDKYLIAAPSDSIGTDALFLSLKGMRLTVRAIENLVKKYAVAAGLGTKISPHKLRATFGTLLYEETSDIYLVADALGHKSVDTTRAHYADITESHKRRAAQIDIF
ncbi:MAG: tyrosine-type recombinase/integrase [Lachnospiraceae bacterium]|nr:tyrosine-type recombinase/integrase [Lachnospiraceae bacterium]